MNKITCIVLTKNEEGSIKKCLESVAWCDHLLVVDDYSTDKTIRVAKDSGAKVYKRALKNNFSSQRNYGLGLAKTQWVLFIDADEIVTNKLQKEIKKAIKSEYSNGYFIPREDYWLKKRLSHGEFGSSKLLRLAKKGKGKWVRAVHERWQVSGRVGELKNPIRHYPHKSTREFLGHINFYSGIHASENKKEGKRSSLIKILFIPAGKFFNNFILKLGFLDGAHGFVAALMMSFHSFLSWSKLWKLQNSK